MSGNEASGIFNIFLVLVGLIKITIDDRGSPCEVLQHGTGLKIPSEY